ncbi:MAG: DUF885 domain-containing protein [Terriglobia bacterium]
MMKRIVALASAIVVLWYMALTVPRNMRAGSPKNPADFNRLVDNYFDFYFQFHPKEATAAGFHQYDSKLEDYSRASREGEISNLRTFGAEFDRLDPAKLPAESAGDLAFLQNTIKARLLELQSVQMWRKDPGLYVGDTTDSIFVLVKRSFAPPEERLRSVIARARQIPGALLAAHDNLSNPPQIYTQIALEQMPGIIEFFQKDVPGAFQGVKDAALWVEFQRSNGDVVKALEDFQLFLQNDLLPRSRGDFRIGEDNFRKKLHDEEMVDIPLDELLKIGYADLHRNQQQFKDTAVLINPNADPREVLATLEKDHPAPDQLLPSFRNLLGSLREFIEAKKIITVPSSILPLLEETPPFMRATTTASMDTPGAYESKATEAMFNVTTPESGWTPQAVEEWMQGFNRGTILSTSIHEAYPGHYVQFLWAKRLTSKVRKLLYCNSNTEGWAHYTEQMMLDEGYGGGDPKLRMGQLQDALLRNSRFIVGIEMHTGNMTMEQAKEFFVREGYQVPAVADVEAKRGTSDPTYLVYTLGKLQIMKLREDYKKKLGDSFALRDFHDRFMEQGGVPLVIIRKTMLGDNSPTL